MTVAVTEREGKDVSPTDCMVLSTSQRSGGKTKLRRGVTNGCNDMDRVKAG
jgi:hypothetical protein